MPDNAGPGKLSTRRRHAGFERSGSRATIKEDRGHFVIAAAQVGGYALAPADGFDLYLDLQRAKVD
jgi:hypothetical protein